MPNLLPALGLALVAAGQPAPAPAPAATPPSRSAMMQGAYEQSRNPGLLVVVADALAAEGKVDALIATLGQILASGADVAIPSHSAVHRVADPRIAVLVEQINGRTARTRHYRSLTSLAPMRGEGIAADPLTGRLFVGDVGNRRILSVDPATGATRPFGATLAMAPAGMAVDARRRLLWVATSAGLADPAASGTALVRCGIASGQCTAVPGSAKMLNDVTVAADGRVYASDFGGGVYTVAPGGARMELVPGTAELSFANGLTMSRSGRYLYLAHGLSPSAIDLRTGQRTRLADPAYDSLMGIDGLYRVGSSLLAIQNAAHDARLVAIDLADDEVTVRRVRVLENRAEGLGTITTGATLGQQFYLLADAQLATGGPAQPLRPLKVARYDLRALMAGDQPRQSANQHPLSRPSPYEIAGPAIAAQSVAAVGADGLAYDVYPATGGGSGVVVLVSGAMAGAPDPRSWVPLKSWARSLARSGMTAILPGGGGADPAALARLGTMIAGLRAPGGRFAGQPVCILAFSAGGRSLDHFSRDPNVACRAGLYPLLSAASAARDASASPLFLVRAGDDRAPGILAGFDAFMAAAAKNDVPFTLVNLPHHPHAFDFNGPTAGGQAMTGALVEYLRTYLNRSAKGDMSAPRD